MGIRIDKELGDTRSLRDEFAIPDSDDASDISTALYKEELNEQKIEKLGNRVTIISVLLPCLTGVILLYGYLDIKERVMIIHNSGQTQVDVVAREFETKLNSIEVELERMKFSLEKDIPELKQQTIAIQDELTLLAGTKSDREETSKRLELIKTSIDNITGQYQDILHLFDRSNQETLDIVTGKVKEMEAAMDLKLASVKTIQADIDAGLVSLKAVESSIDSKIDSRIAAVAEKRGEVAIDKRVRTVINEKLASHSQALDKKVADIDLSVESKLAALQEVTEILAESRTTIKQLETGIGELRNSVTTLDREFKTYKLKSESDIEKQGQENKNKPDIDRQYVDSQIIGLKKNLNARIDQLDLTLSKKIIQYATKLEESARRNKSSARKNSSEAIVTKPERGKISETDLAD